MIGLAVSIALGIVLVAKSQPPAPTPSVRSEVAQQQTAEPKTQSTDNKGSSSPDSSMLSQHDPSPDDGPHDDQSEREDYISSAEWWSWFNATAVTAFTGVLMVIAVLQWITMRAETKAARDASIAAKASVEVASKTLDQMRLEQRPWLAAVSAKITTMEVGKQFLYEVSIINSGKSPARIYEHTNFAIFITHTAGTPFAPEHLRLLDEQVEKALEKISADDSVSTVIMPGQCVPFPNFKRAGPLTAKAIDDIKHHITRMYVVDIFSFIDVATNTKYERLRFDFLYSRECNAFLTHGNRVTIK